MSSGQVVVLCPTRGRPERAQQLIDSFRATAELVATDLVLVVDEDDPALPAYEALSPALHSPFPLQPASAIGVMTVRGGNLTLATNEAAARIWDDDLVIGHVGDDHLFRTPGWDARMLEALDEPGIAYGDDLHQRERLPTAVFMSSAIARALGWFALPTAEHLYIDRAWRELGERLSRLHYLPHVVIEHMHPDAGKAELDDGYRSANSDERYRLDRAAFRSWLGGPVGADIRRVQAALERQVVPA